MKKILDIIFFSVTGTIVSILLIILITMLVYFLWHNISSGGYTLNELNTHTKNNTEQIEKLHSDIQRLNNFVRENTVNIQRLEKHNHSFFGKSLPKYK